MLKAGIMRNKPQVPAFYDQPLKSNLSPHYRRARELQKTANEITGDYAVAKTALVNAKIELKTLEA